MQEYIEQHWKQSFEEQSIPDKLNKEILNKTHTAKQDASIRATGVRFILFVTSPTAHMLGMLVREYSST